MWEVLYNLSRGRYPGRRFSLVLATVLMVFFVTLIPVQPAFADDVQRGEDGSVTYQNNTYQPILDTSGNPAIALPSGLPSGTEGYFRRDDANGKVHFLLTSSGAAQATTAQYVVYDFTPPDTFTGSSPPVSVNFVAATNQNQSAPTSGSSCDGSTLSGIGWIVCPVVNLLATSMDFIYGIISDFLEVKTVTADTNGPVYRLWSIVRDISNICFVIVFLFIMYSQITSLGISNYGLKKMLPRLIIAAILMNTSYWISAFAVDASNLLGYSIHSVFRSVFDTLSVGANYAGDIPTWQQVAAVALASTGAVVGGITILSGTISGSVLLLIPILVSVALAALVALLVLAARQALLMCLIIISPLAFVGFVLPNTEKYFEKWRSTFLTLLMLFPIFSVIFSGAQLAGMAIVQTSGGNLITIILGMGVQVAPIVITPLLVKFSSGLIGKIAGMVNNPNKGIVDRTRNWAKGAQQERKNKILSDQNTLKKFNKYNPALAGTRTIDTYNRRRDARRKAYEAGAENRYDATKTGQRTQALTRDMQSQKQEVANRFERSSYGQRSNFRSQMANIDKDRTNTEFEQSGFGHQVDRAKRVAEQDKKLVHNQHERDWNQTVRTNPGLLQQELGVKASELQAGLEKAKLEKVHAEVVAQGHNTEHILNLHGVDVHTQAGILNIARDIKDISLDTSITSTAKNMAERKFAQVRADELKADTVRGDMLRTQASGILRDEGGRESVMAEARSTASKFLVDDIKNIEATTDNNLSTNVEWLRGKLMDEHGSITFAERIAYSNLLSKAGAQGVERLKKVIAYYDDKLGADIQTSEELQDYKDFMKGNPGFTSAGKDLEFWATNDGDIDPVTHVKTYRSFDDITKRSATWGNISPRNFTTLNVASQFRALQVLYNTDRKKYDTIVNSLKANDGMLMNELKDSIRNQIVDVDNGTKVWDSIPIDLFDKA
ncbi:MAG: hypothetical protein WBP12_04265 [Candidatus Saccharimonas sp.]